MRTKGGGWNAILRAITAMLIIGAAPVIAALPASADPSCTFNSQAPPLTGVAPGAVVAVLCNNLPPLQRLTINEESPLAAIVEPSSSAPFEASSATATTVTADESGALLATFTIPDTFTAVDPAAACPPTAAQIDAGLTNCVLALRDADTSAPLAAPAALVYTNQVAPTPTPTISVVNGTSFVAGDIITFSGTGFWGSVTGTAPTVLFGSTPAASLPGSPVEISKPTYFCATDCHGEAGVLTPGGAVSGNAVVPSGLLAGATTIAVIQADSTPFPGTGPFGALAGTTQVTILGPPTATASPSSGGPGTVVHVTGTGWDPQGPTPVLSFLTSTAEPGQATTAVALVDLNGNIAGELTVGATDAPGVNPIVVAQAGLNAQAAYTVTDSVTSCAATPCADNSVITQTVTQGELSLSQQSFNVALSAVSLTGAAQHSTGQLNPITVSDSRGTLVGWTVTGTLQGNFLNESATGQSANNSIPASNLTWIPSVSLAADGSGILEQVRPGDSAPLSTSAGTTLCSAPVGGGGGSYVCTAGLDLLIPGSVAVGAYSAVLNVTIT